MYPTTGNNKNHLYKHFLLNSIIISHYLIFYVSNNWSCYYKNQLYNVFLCDSIIISHNIKFYISNNWLQYSSWTWLISLSYLIEFHLVKFYCCFKPNVSLYIVQYNLILCLQFYSKTINWYPTFIIPSVLTINYSHKNMSKRDSLKKESKLV